MGLVQLTATQSPLTVEEVKAHCRIDGVEDDLLLSAYALAATEFFQSRTNTQVMAADFRLTLPAFPSCTPYLILPRPPLLSVSAVKYIDPAGQTRTLDLNLYVADASARPGRVVVAPDASWPAPPSLARRPDAVTVEFRAGYADRHAVPMLAKQAIKFLTAHYYENRESVITGTIVTELPLAVQSILDICSFPEAV